MTSLQQIEIEKYHDEIVDDVKNLIEKYRKIMDWEIPENNEQQANQLIIAAVQNALDKIKEDS
jgi:hypothetical protein